MKKRIAARRKLADTSPGFAGDTRRCSVIQRDAFRRSDPAAPIPNEGIALSPALVYHSLRKIGMLATVKLRLNSPAHTSSTRYVSIQWFDLKHVCDGLGRIHQLPIPGETAVLAAQAQQRIFAEKIQQGRARVLQLLPQKPGDCRHIIGVPRFRIGALFPLGDFLGQHITKGVAQETLFLPLIVFIAPGHGVEVFHDSLVAEGHPHLQPDHMLMRSFRSNSVCMNHRRFSTIISFMRRSNGSVPGRISACRRVS